MAPHPPRDLKVDSKGSRVLNISWAAGFNGHSEILNYKVEISEKNQNFANAKCQGLSHNACVVSSSSKSASLEDLHPGRMYGIRVFATNNVGRSVPSSVLNTTTDEEGTLCVTLFSIQ